MKLLWFLSILFAFMQAGEGKIEIKKIYTIFSVSNFTEHYLTYLPITFNNVGPDAKRYIHGNQIYLQKSILSSSTPDNITTVPTLYESKELGELFQNLFTHYSIHNRDIPSYQTAINIANKLSENDGFVWYIDSKPIDPNLQTDFFRVLASKKILFGVKSIGDREFTRGPDYFPLEMASGYFAFSRQLEEKENAIRKYKNLLANPDLPNLLKRQQEQREATNKALERLNKEYVPTSSILRKRTQPQNDDTEVEILDENFTKWAYYYKLWNVHKKLSTFVYDVAETSKQFLVSASYSMKLRYGVEQSSPFRLSNYSLVISAQPDSIQTIDASAQYSTEDFRKLFEPFNNVTSKEIVPLKGLLKALQIAPPDSQIVFITNINPKGEYQLLPEVLDIMIEKQIQIIIYKIDENPENNILHAAYKMINEVYNQNVNPQY